MRHGDPGCAAIGDRLDEAAVASPASPLGEHLARCGECAELVERHRRLVLLLSAMPSVAPAAEFGPPALPGTPAGRMLRVPAWLATAAAAAALVVIGVRIASGPGGRVRVERVVDVADAPPPVDERLLALTAGAEAVAMRRPTEFR